MLDRISTFENKDLGIVYAFEKKSLFMANGCIFIVLSTISWFCGPD